jgi:GNAT superfamily N-acetyltransferase
MARRVAGITLDNLDDLPGRCRRCVFWEAGPTPSDHPVTCDPDRAAAWKESWVSTVLLDWGGCGSIVYVDGDPAGFVLYAPPGYVPRAEAFGSSPVSPDAVLLMTAAVRAEDTGAGLGRVLIQTAAKDLIRRGFRAIEAFGTTSGRQGPCVLPVDYLLSVGFKTVRPHPLHPRLRLELRTIVTWREDLESAIERLLGTVASDRAPRPV